MSRKRRRRGNKQTQKEKLKFGSSLERYAIGRIQSLPIRWEWVGIGLLATVLVTSIIVGYREPAPLSNNRNEAIVVATKNGDYALAQKLYEQRSNETRVLGVDSKLEELVYPERIVQNEIERQEAKLLEYPNSRDLLWNLAQLYQQIGEQEMATEYRERARILDPNNEIFKSESL